VPRCCACLPRACERVADNLAALRVCGVAALLHVITKADRVPIATRNAISAIFRREIHVEGDQPFWIVNCGGADPGPHAAFAPESIWRVMRAALGAVNYAEPGRAVERPLIRAGGPPDDAYCSMTVTLRNHTGYAFSRVARGLAPEVRSAQWRRPPPPRIGAGETVWLQLASAAPYRGLWDFFWEVMPTADGSVTYMVNIPVPPAGEGVVEQPTVVLAWEVGRWAQVVCNPRLEPRDEDVLSVFELNRVSSWRRANGLYIRDRGVACAGVAGGNWVSRVCCC
jgi:hypothetical protein